MKTSANGRAFTEAFEGKRLKAYRDGGGVWTIGYGHTSAAGAPHVYPGMVITDAEADQILANDLGHSEARVEKAIRVELTQYEFDALVDFDLNTGAIDHGTVDDKINRGDKKGAMATLLQYDHDGGKVITGLARRRQAEKLMFEGKVQPALALAGVHKQIGYPTPKAIKRPPSEPRRAPPVRSTEAPATLGPQTYPEAPKSWISVLLEALSALFRSL